MGFVEGQDAPRLADEAAIRQGLAEAKSAVAVWQVESDRFMSEVRAAVIPGHAPVNAPGRQVDPDIEPDASDQ